MATNMFYWLKHDQVLSLTLCALLQSINQVSSNDGICTRSEVVSKSRPQHYTQTYVETYTDYSGRSCRWYGCHRTRVSERYLTRLEIYTVTETKQYCCAGYEESSSLDLYCSPVCDFLCPHGKCTRPNYCECYAGYKKKTETENICEPVCSEECIHGYCSAPEVCSCNFGYHHDPSLSRYVCSPVCTNPCVNANCTSPDVCTCLQGFAKTLIEPHKCHAVCSPHCHNGVCTSPGECTCFEGYEKNNSTWNVCDPVCLGGCENGNCTAPGKCTCFDGYEKIESVCEPKCSRECLNGLCTEPETCSCHQGYRKSLDPYSCAPICSLGCVNSNCTEPEHCECFPGFEESEDTSVCRPQCSDGCQNGVCTDPDECTCLWGFKSGNDSSNCTRKEGEHFECNFINKFVNHDFDRSCFKINEISFANLENCNILKYLAYNEEIRNATIDLSCGDKSDVEMRENKLQLSLECVVKLKSSEESFGFEEFTSTLVYNEEQDFSSSSESNIFSSSETSVMTEDSLSTETTETEIAADKRTYTIGVNNQEKTEFSIIPMRNSTKITELSNLPLYVNITLKFLPLIESSQMTQDYFDNITSAKKEICVCHQDNQRNWSICAGVPAHLHLCPCGPRKYQILTEESRTGSSLKTTIWVLVPLVAVAAVAYVLYNIYRSGSYLITDLTE